MKYKAHSKLHTSVIIALLMIISMIIISCDILETPQPPQQPQQPQQPPSGGEQPPQPEPLPDLVIAAIEVFPAQPQAGQYFSVNVYVNNVGKAPSGEYDLALFIRDVSRGSTYPIGTFRREKLQPGENIVAYSSSDRLVNDSGSFQVHAEIQPFLFQDGNNQNNALIWAFTVK
jgi:hypothetical protein